MHGMRLLVIVVYSTYIHSTERKQAFVNRHPGSLLPRGAVHTTYYCISSCVLNIDIMDSDQLNSSVSDFFFQKV